MPRLSHILLVDGDPASLHDNTVLIRDYRDCEITTATSGEEAVNIVKDVWFDLILMDCDTPDVDGYGASVKIGDLVKEKRIEPVPIIGILNGQEQEEEEGGLFSKLTSKLKGAAGETKESKCEKYNLKDLIESRLMREHLEDQSIIREVLKPIPIFTEATSSGSMRILSKEQDEALKTLELSAGVTKSELKSKYRDLAKQYHPDVCRDDPDAGKKFTGVNEAYEELIKSDLFPDD